MTEPQNQFEELILKACNELGETLILKNRDYGNSYSGSRERFKAEPYYNEKIPFVFHATEKLKRYETCGSLDSVLDLAGYSILELVCRRQDL